MKILMKQIRKCLKLITIIGLGENDSTCKKTIIYKTMKHRIDGVVHSGEKEVIRKEFNVDIM